MRTLKTIFILLLCCMVVYAGQNLNDNNNMEQVTDEQLKAKIVFAIWNGDEDFLRKNLTSENVNELYDIPGGYIISVSTDDPDYDYGFEEMNLLHFAIIQNSVASVKILIEKGADIEAIGWQGQTPLQYMASYSNRDDIAKILIENKANVNLRYKWNGYPLLFNYIKFSRFELARFAIKHGADVNMKDENGNTILTLAEQHHEHYASRTDRDWNDTMSKIQEIISLLKEKGATK